MNIPVLKIGKHQPRYPLIQGGMGVAISGVNLAGHVAGCGGIGTIASVGLCHDSPHFTNKQNYFEVNQIVMREAVQNARKIAEENINPMIGDSRPVIAVNCMVALTDYDTQVRSSCEGGVDIMISGAGLPLRLPEYTKDFPDVALVPIVSSAKAASLIARHWDKKHGRLPDGFVVETPHTAGGHLGASTIEQVYSPELALDVALPGVVKYVAEELKIDIPVIAAGGIWDGSDMRRAFELGARGVQVGTRFVCTEECDAAMRFKQAYIDATEDDIVLINSPAGLPGRAIRNPFISAYLEGEVESKPCFANCLSHCRYKKDRSTFCIAMALVDGCLGNWESGLFFCGSNAAKAEKIEKVEEVMHDFFNV
ncbi:MAG: nitronate monooxygenase family protein [Synergistaceae bacterium]|nr:nitronate monooxygenase family protein [Synergistaceae bacterium]